MGCFPCSCPLKLIDRVHSHNSATPENWNHGGTLIALLTSVLASLTVPLLDQVGSVFPCSSMFPQINLSACFCRGPQMASIFLLVCF